MEISFKQHLQAFDWGSDCLDESGEFARLGVVSDGGAMESGFEPYAKRMRGSRRRLGLSTIYLPGMMVKFSRALLDEKYGDGYRWISLAIRAWSIVSRSGLAGAAVFEGLVDVPSGKRFSDFPFDQYLSPDLGWTGRFGDRVYRENDGTPWRISNSVLCRLKCVTVLLPDDPHTP